MNYSRVRPRSVPGPLAQGVYAELDELVRLQFKAKGFTFLPRQPVHSLLSGRRASRIRGRGLDFEELRGYLPGDDVRTIDWRVTARTQKPYVRVFTEERDRPVLILVDQRLGMFFGSRERMKSVTAAEAAALAAWRTLAVGDRAGALVFDDQEVTEVRPHRSRERVMEILRAVVEKNHALRVDSGIEPGPAMLNETLSRAARQAKHDYLVVVISDFQGANEATRRLLTQMAAHNDVLAALIYDPLSVDMPPAGRLVVSDGDLQLEADLGQKATRGRLTDFMKNRQRDLGDRLRQIGIPMLALSTVQGVAEQIRSQLGAVASQGRGGMR